MDTRFHGADLGRSDRRDLLIGEAFYVAEQQRRALVRRYVPKRLLNAAQRFTVGCEIGELGARRGRLGPTCGIVIFRGGIERKLGMPPPRAELVQRAVGHDAKNPRTKRSSL